MSGDFEIHITTYPGRDEKLESFAAQHGLKYVHILLDRGTHPSQPMLTLVGRGSLAEQQVTLRHWQNAMRAAGLYPCRSKIEAAPSCPGVPRSDEETVTEPAGRYFEHHVKLLLPTPRVTDLIAITDLVASHSARLSRNARRRRDDGNQERFVTQRCHGVGLATAKRRLDALVDAIRARGYEIARVEQEYVVFDSQIHLDQGWLESPATNGRTSARENTMRTAPAAAPDYPPTYQPLPAGPGLHQRAAFDPAVKQYPNAYRAGEPEFLTADTGHRWKTARRAAMNHVLTAIAGTTWAEHLVLRGSVTLTTWVGDAAREPGDLDFVVTPHAITSNGTDAAAMFRDIKTAIQTMPGAGLQPERATETAIWTYERADGRRLVIPFQTNDAPNGHVQVDVVFGEHLPLPPEVLLLPGLDIPVLAASAPLSLAWKLLWLATDRHPQGKDLYDAALLAEYTTVDLALVRDLIRPELSSEADTFTAETVLAWSVDWTNFTDEYPNITGASEHWTRRLALALDRAWH